MKRKLLLTCTALAMSLFTSSVAFADATEEEEGTVTGDEFAPDWADPDFAAKLSQAQADSRIITLKNASGCAITITGGTETGHASGTYSHWNGYKVDISFSSCIDGYITRSFPYIGKRGDGAPMYKSAAGNIYARESNHWDITYF